MGIAASWETMRRNQDKPWSCFFLAEMSRPIVDFRTGSVGSVEEAEGVSPTAASKGAGAWQVKLLKCWKCQVESFARRCLSMTRL